MREGFSDFVFLSHLEAREPMKNHLENHENLEKVPRSQRTTFRLGHRELGQIQDSATFPSARSVHRTKQESDPSSAWVSFEHFSHSAFPVTVWRARCCQSIL